jgi:hypothetical protein
MSDTDQAVEFNQANRAIGGVKLKRNRAEQ